MTVRAFQVNPADNVATLIDDAPAGAQVKVLGSAAGLEVASAEAIAQGHKIALRDVAAGEAVTKFGVAIGRAAAAIRAGDWVHLHNCVSNFDERSQTLDPHTGAVTDTTYE